MRNEFLDDDDDDELHDVALHNYSERDSLIANTGASASPPPGQADASSDSGHLLHGQGEDASLLRSNSTNARSSAWGVGSIARSVIMALRSCIVLTSHGAHSAAAAVTQLFRRESNGGYSLADPAAASPAPPTPLRTALICMSIIFIARLVLIRYWSIMQVLGAAGSPSLSSDQTVSNHMLWFAQDVSSRASSCAPQQLHLPAASPFRPTGDGLEVCSVTRDCAPTLLLMMHSWGSGMQQLWFDSDISPLLSLPPDVNIVFATSINGADVVTRHMLDRLGSLAHAGSFFEWIASLLGIAAAAPPVHVIEQQLSQQHRSVAPFLYAAMSAYPTPVSAIEVRLGADSVMAIEGVDGGAWLGSKAPQMLQLCVMEMRSAGCDAFDVSPFDGCVAIVDDGGCSYETKATNAAAAGAVGILVVADDEAVSVMGCKTCQLLPLFGSMISRGDGDRLRRAIDADSSARIVYTSAHRPPSALAIDSSGCARQLGHITGWHSIVLEAKYHSALARRRRDALALLSPAQQLQNQSAGAVFKTALKRDAHPPADAAHASAGNSSLLSTLMPTATDCIGCDSFMLPIMMRTSMSEKVSATVYAQHMPRQGAFNRAVAYVMLDCPGFADTNCGEYDYVVSLNVRGKEGEDKEIMRVITAYRRGGEWSQDITPFIPLLASSSSDSNITLTLEGTSVYYSVTLFIIFSRSSSTSTPVISLPVSPSKGHCSGIWDCFWNPNGHIMHIAPPSPPSSSFSRTELVVVVSGHGWGVDAQNCLEFCPQTHVFEVEGCGQVSVDFADAGVRGACELQVDDGVVPNQFGQWTSGRSNWCPGSIVKSHTFDVTSCAQGLGVRHAILTPVGGKEFVFEESATPVASGFPPMLRMAAWMVYYAD